MLSDGTLMRLSRDDFHELIRDPLLLGVSPATAITRIDQGAQWLDLRYPEDRAKSLLRSSHNIPFNVLRLQANRLDNTKKYIACCDDPAQSAVGAFLLIERGVSVVYLDEPLSKLIVEHPSVLAPQATDGPTTDKVVVLPVAARRPETRTSPSPSEEPDMDEHQPDGDRFENTIDKIDRLYSQKEWEAEKAARVPVEDYAHTVTGQRLADLIDEMDVNHEKLPDSAASEDVHRLTASNFGADDVIDIAPDTNTLSQTQQPNVLLVDTHAPMPVSEDETLHDELFDERDGLARIMQDFEYRIRDYVETVAFQRTADTERKYQNKIRRIRKAAALEVRKRQDLSRQRYEQQYKKKELQLRAHYKKVMALANKISRQKAELQQAKKQFEDKLSAANAVYKQVEDMRKTLRQHIGDIPAGPEEDERRSA
jgi:rhodanese-related sulfurtransferase